MHDVASPARVFVEERCVLDPAATVAVADLYAAWVAWCRETGNRPGSTQTFSRDLRTVHRELKTIRPRVGGHQGPRCWLGIRLNDHQMNNG
jgi:putative DNA primase/helicase